MTPAAITPAARKQAVRSGSAAPAAGPTHRRTAPKRPAPPARPRRVSGPAGGRVAAAAAAITAPAIPRPQRPQRPQRSRRRVLPAAPARVRRRSGPLSARAAAFVRSLPDHRLLDRAVRGRAWIPILGVMLAGIVAMQVEVLKLGASIGRSIQRSSALQAKNEALRASVGALVDDQRITRLAAKAGMVMPSPSGVGFLSANAGGQMQAVLRNIRAPDVTTFLALTTSNGAVQTSASSDPYSLGSSSTLAASTSAGSTSSASTSSTDMNSASTASTAATAATGTPVASLAGSSNQSGVSTTSGTTTPSGG